MVSSPEEVRLLFALFLCTGKEVKGRSGGGEGEVEPPTSEQLPHLLHQLHVGLRAQGGKGRLRDPKHLNISNLRGGRGVSQKSAVLSNLVLHTCQDWLTGKSGIAEPIHYTLLGLSSP